MRMELSASVEALKEELETLRPRFVRTKALVNEPVGQLMGDYFLLYAVCRSFAPDLILEVGRNWGNSTAVFIEAAHRVPGCRVVSVDLNNHWGEDTEPRLRTAYGADWLRPLTAHLGDVRNFSAESLLGSSRRVVVFWDAHGRDVGEYLTSRLLPALAGREHLVLVHDLTDRRFAGPAEADRWHDPQGRRLWWMGNWISNFEELLPLYDFWCRNGIEPVSTCEALHGSAAAGWLAEWSREDARTRTEPRPWSACVMFSMDPGGAGRTLFFPPPDYRNFAQCVRDRRPKALVLYGASGGGKSALGWIAGAGVDVPVAAFVDGDPAKWGTALEGIPVLSPEDLRRFDPRETLVVLSSIRRLEIKDRIRALGWPAEAVTG